MPPYRLDIDSDDFYDPANQNTYSAWTVPFTLLPEFDYVSLLSFSCPKSYYMITPGYNTFIVSDGITQHTITMPVGSYNYVTMARVLKPLLDAVGYGAFIITFDQASSKYLFANATANLRFIFSNTFAEKIGFFVGEYLFTAGFLESARPINLQLTNVVVIETNLVRSRQNSSINQRILHAVPDNAPVAGNVTYQNNSPKETMQELENVGQVFRINLFDNNNRPLDPQQGCNLTLLFYKAEDIDQNIEAKSTNKST